MARIFMCSMWSGGTITADAMLASPAAVAVHFTDDECEMNQGVERMRAPSHLLAAHRIKEPVMHGKKIFSSLKVI